MLRSTSACLTAVSLFLFMTGCSGGKGALKTVPASGKVTYKDLPVVGATVSFLGDGKTPPAVALTDSAGEFVLTTARPGDGAVPAMHQVTVSKFIEGVTKAAKTKMTMEEAAKAAQEPPPTKPLSMLPERYSSADTSDLKYEVKSSGSNVFEIKLTD